MTMIAVKQINQQQLIDFIAVASSGSAFSGNLTSYLYGSGALGPNVVATSGGSQYILGDKTFLDKVFVAYSGGTGAAPSAQYVIDLINSLSGNVVTNYATYSFVSGLSGVLASVSTPNVVTTTGNEVIGGFKQFTGSPFVPSPTAPSGAANRFLVTGISGILQGYINSVGGGGGTPNAVTTTGNEVIGGFKQFTGSPLVPTPTTPSGATNMFFVTGMSGILSAGGGLTVSGYVENNFVHRTNISETISGLKTFTGAVGIGVPTTTGHAVNLGYLTGVSGVLQAAIGAGSSTTNNYSFTGITGNFVNMSYYFDQYNFMTGQSLIETMVARSFFFTGYAIGVINSGTQNQALSGTFYQRDQNSVRTNFINFTLNRGLYFYASGGYNQTITGLNRIGLDIYSTPTGMTGVTIGLFGVGY